MEFTFETTYDLKATTAMAKGLRRTIRKKRNRRSRILGWIVLVLALLLIIPSDGEPFVLDVRTVVTLAASLILLLTLFFEDKINGYFACRRMMPGTAQSTSVFGEEQYVTTTGAGTTQWHYANIQAIAEDASFFIFLFDKRYAQVYDKSTLSGGTVEQFRAFIAQKTEKEVVFIK